jgi:AmiR/NasT family two-component response regulator
VDSHNKPVFVDHQVHQAEGVLAARYRVSIREATSMLRAWAAQHEVAVPDMAAQLLGTLSTRRKNGHPTR